MKTLPVITAVLLFVAACPGMAAPKNCDELKAEIAAKLDAKGVKNYQLEIVATADAGNSIVIGSCESGQKKITYKKV